MLGDGVDDQLQRAGLGEHQLVLVGALADLVLRLPATLVSEKLTGTSARESSHQEVAELGALVAQLGEDDILPRADHNPDRRQQDHSHVLCGRFQTFSPLPARADLRLQDLVGLARHAHEEGLAELPVDPWLAPVLHTS